LQVESDKVNKLALANLKTPVLDLGCFKGDKTAFLNKHFEHAEGCDISLNALVKATEKFPEIRFTQYDYEKENMSERIKFNSIFCTKVIEHVFDVQAFLKNCNASLNENGILFLTTPNVKSFLNRIRLLFGDETNFKIETGHLRFFTPETISKELEQAGFEIVLIDGYNVRPVVERLWFPLNFYEGIIVVAKKMRE